MYIGITEQTRLADIQKEFNDQYPYLKLEFYKNNSQRDNGYQKTEKLKPEELVNHITRFYNAGSIHLDNDKTVARLVAEFLENFGLSTLVFRKSGNSWIETSLTDNWSLEKQNNIGEFIFSSGQSV